MAKSPSTLEEFFENYIKNKSIKNSAKSYTDYIKEKGGDYREDYSRGVQRAMIDRLKGDTGHGTDEEAILSHGLTGSGYSEYLRRKNSFDYDGRIASLDRGLYEKESDLRQGYLSYLSDFEENQMELRERVMNNLIDRGVVDEKAAYNYAINAGLEPKDALAVGKSVFSTTLQALRKKIMDEISLQKMSSEGAIAYAKALGMSDSEAEKLGEFAKYYEDYFLQFTDGYLEYLEELGNKNTGPHALTKEPPIRYTGTTSPEK